MKNEYWLMKFESMWGSIKYRIKYLISFGLSFLDIEGKVFPWYGRQGPSLS